MADIIDYKVYGEEMQMVEVELDPGEVVRGEIGAMMYMETGIVMQTGCMQQQEGTPMRQGVREV